MSTPNTLLPIPASPRVAKREYRHRVVPKIVFGGAIVALFFLWLWEISSPSLVGQVEPTLVIVNSPKTGILMDFNLERLQPVKAGDPVAQIVTTDPKILESSLAVIQAEIRLMKMNMEPGRYAMQHDRLRLEWMDQRASLAGAKVKLQQAENDLRRAKALSQGKIVSDSVLEKAQALRDKLQADIEQRGSIVAELENTLRRNDPQGAGTAGEASAGPQDVLKASIAVQEEKLRLTEAELSPIVLRAPINGTVDMIHHHSGETVLAGAPIATINALTSEHIVGYVSQPGAFRLAVGMPVEVRSRFGNKPYAKGEILKVGTQMEPINPLLLPTASALVPILGLPVDISVPKTLHLLPGEVVDLALR